jgi:outer membrane receptor protein involved in Fe transport
LKADFSKTVSFGVDATFSNYSVDLEAEAWNLPALEVGSSIDVNITKKWYAGANFFYIGERFDSRQLLSFDPIISDAPTKQTLEGYFDLNAHVGYKYSDRLTAFIRAHNIANQDYQRWLDYPVQGFQAIIGASYKFDF